MIRTKTTYSKEVFNEFAKHNIKTSGSMKVIYACAVIILACALVMAVLGSIVEAIVYGILGLIFAGYSPLMKAIINANNRRNIGTTDEYEFYDDKFYVAAYDKNGVEMASSTIMYSRLYKVKRNFGYGYIYVNKQVAYIVQRENFENREEYDIVLDRIQKAIRGSKIKGTTPAVFGSQNVTPASEEGEQYLGEPVPPPETEEDILARKALEAQKAAEEAAKAEAEEAEKENAEGEETSDVEGEEAANKTEETLETETEETEPVEESTETEPVIEETESNVENFEESTEEVEEDPAVVEAEKALTEADEVLANAVEIEETEEDSNLADVEPETDDDNDNENGAAEQQPVDEVVNNFIVNEVNDMNLEDEAEEAEETEEDSNQNDPFENTQPEFVEDNYDELPEPVDPYAQYNPQPVVENLNNQEDVQPTFVEQPAEENVENSYAEAPVVVAAADQEIAEEETNEDEEDDEDEDKPARKRKKRATTKKKTALTEKRGRGRPRKEESAKDKKPKRGRGRPRKEETDKKPKRGRGRPPKAESEKKSKKAVGEKRGRGRPRKEETTKTKKTVKKVAKPVQETPVQQDATPVYQAEPTSVVAVANTYEQPAAQPVEETVYEAPAEQTFVQPTEPVYAEPVQAEEVYNEPANEESFEEPTIEDVEAEESFEEANIPDTVSEEDMADAQALLREYGEAPAEEVEDVQPVIEENFETEENFDEPADVEEETFTAPEIEDTFDEEVEDEIPEAPVRFTETIADDPDYQPVQPLSAQFVETANSDVTYSVDTSDETDDSDDSTINIGSMPDDI